MRLALKDQYQSFFLAIGGSRPSENYLSRMFQACFSESPVFAQCVLGVLWKACGIDGVTPDATKWVCEYQPTTPGRNGGRPDLCLRPTPNDDVPANFKPIFLESKVGSKLTEKQLQNYKDSGIDVLVAITKNWPEVPQTHLKKLIVESLRWQDISRALSQVTNRSSKDKFLCKAFSDYLEQNGMAYREDLSKTHLEEVRSLLSRVAYPKYLSFVPGSSFDLANSCLALLRDVKRIAREHPAPAKWSTGSWGPGYWHEQDEKGGPITSHVFGFELYPRGKYRQTRIVCGMYFSAEEKGSIRWYIAHYGRKATEDEYLDLHISRLLSKNKLDAKRLAKSVVDCARRWKLC